MPDPPGPPAGAQQLSEPPVPLTLDLKREVDNWVGALEVYWFEQDRVWCWRLTNSGGKLIQDGRDLQMAGEQSHEQAMKVLLQFLLATADNPLSVFYDATTVWAVMNRKALAKVLESV
jgi:hypothetical protein